MQHLQRITAGQFSAGQFPATKSAGVGARAGISTAASTRCLITGGNTGIGYETAKALCAKGWDVTIACRDVMRASAAIASLKQGQPGAQVSSIQLDLADQASIKAAAARLLDAGVADFDVLLNNAGVMATPKMQTKDGFEFQLGINHLGHFTLTNMLLPAMLAANKPLRIINVASAAHVSGGIRMDDLFREKPGAYQPWEAYGQSKLANIMFTYELARQLQSNPKVTVNCLHPGVVRTELGRYMLEDKSNVWMTALLPVAALFFKTPEQGAETSIYLASSPEVTNVTSKYFSDCRPTSSSKASYDVAVGKQLWERSAELTQVQAAIPQKPAVSKAVAA